MIIAAAAEVTSDIHAYQSEMKPSSDKMFVALTRERKLMLYEQLDLFISLPQPTLC